MEIIASAQATTPSTTKATAPSATGSSPRPPCQGRTITTTPANPTKMAVVRRQPTRSPSSGTDSTVRNSGIANPSAVTIANGSIR